jgi:hypothetical protein
MSFSFITFFLRGPIRRKPRDRFKDGNEKWALMRFSYVTDFSRCGQRGLQETGFDTTERGEGWPLREHIVILPFCLFFLSFY